MSWSSTFNTVNKEIVVCAYPLAFTKVKNSLSSVCQEATICQASGNVAEVRALKEQKFINTSCIVHVVSGVTNPSPL